VITLETPVAGVILLRDDDAALLQHRDDKPGLRHAGAWVPPGGHSRPGESPEDCARRELMEETGYCCAAEDLEWLSSLMDWHTGWSPYILTVYWAAYDGVQRVRCFEGQAVEFVERERAVSLRVPPYLVGLWDAAIAASRERMLRGSSSQAGR
jgi:8-oxo-dGTP pyrophosphatase MutT (NUDIX family)